MKEVKLIFDKGRQGRTGSVLPKHDVEKKHAISKTLLRKESPMMPEVSELDALRHFINLSRKNFSVDTHFYPLGSCTMKYNPKFHEHIAGLPGFADLHPLLPQLRGGGSLTQGALEVLYEFEQVLCELMGFKQITLQPLAGAHGELTGVMLISAYLKAQNQPKRKIMLIPDNAHGTNPASAAMAGFDCLVLLTDENGFVNLDDLKSKLSAETAGIMLTCPNTLGLFDPNTEKICRLVHDAGGLCYCDGANFNAIMGRLRPGEIGFDVMHINVHKTLATPHGGGGPGAGPVGVVEKLVPFLPVSQVVKRKDGTYELNYDSKASIGYIAPFYGNFAVLLRAYAYLLTLGNDGVKKVSENAVLNANYLKEKLKKYYKIAFDRPCMHECVFSASKQAAEGVSALDLAKALIDNNIHPPTMYFPLIVPEALMIEPTETEAKETLDEFVRVMIELAVAVAEKKDFKNYPATTPVGRLDETLAARKPDVVAL